MSGTLLVNEIYGPVSQGEGPTLGTPCAFLRVAACNLSCVWCDTYYTWDWSRVNKEDEAHKVDYEDVAERVKAVLPPGENPLLVISGGEPLLQQRQLCEVIRLLSGDVRVEVETAGTIAPSDEFRDLVTAFNVSPKLQHSGNKKAKRYRPEVLDTLQASGQVQAWKFVAQQPSDLDEVQELVDAHNLWPVFIMPEGVDRETLDRHARNLSDAVIQRGWRLTPRLHIQMFGNERGR